MPDTSGTDAVARGAGDAEVASEYAVLPDAAGFIRAHAELAVPPLVPELTLWLSHEEPTVLWERLELQTGRAELPPPFWAYPWAGGLALARYVLDHPDVVAGRVVLDLASGSGLVAIAAARAGAARVTANDVDPLAVAAIELNAGANGERVRVEPGNLLAGEGAVPEADLVLVGDACYERRLAHRVFGFLDGLGAAALIGDPGRAYLPQGMRALARYGVPAWAGLEDTEIKETTVWARP
jgi:predicted nicotinamide N-methyase